MPNIKFNFSIDTLDALTQGRKKRKPRNRFGGPLTPKLPKPPATPSPS